MREEREREREREREIPGRPELNGETERISSYKNHHYLLPFGAQERPPNFSKESAVIVRWDNAGCRETLSFPEKFPFPKFFQI